MFRLFYVPCALMSFSRFLSSSALPLYVVTYLGQSESVAGLCISMIGLGKVIMDIPSGFLSKWFKSENIMIASAVLMAAGSWMSARSSNLLSLMLGLVLFGMGMSLTTVSWQLLMSSRIDKSQRSRVSANNGGINRGFAIISPAMSP